MSADQSLRWRVPGKTRQDETKVKFEQLYKELNRLDAIIGSDNTSNDSSLLRLMESRRLFAIEAIHLLREMYGV